MASQIDPQRKPKSVQAGAQPQAVRSAAATTTARVQPSRPAGPHADADQEDEHQEVRPANRGFLGQVPAWAVSMLVHVIALLAMALIAGETVRVEKPTVITSNPSDQEEEPSEIEEPQETVEESTEDVTDPVDAVMAVTDVAVDPVEVPAIADDLDAAPLAVELSEFGAETAPETVGTKIGVLGGTGGGLGGRVNAARLAATSGGGGDTETAVDRALKWFKDHQLPDGGWSFDLKQCPSCAGQCSHSGDQIRLQDRCGATAMALLPFLGRGYTHREGPYKKEVEAGIGFLVGMAIRGKGQAYGEGGSLYSQGLAGIALSECYAMSQDNRLAAPTQAVLNFIMAAQDPRGGGWRYSPRQPGDTSAVGWQIMALKSGHMAYLQINPLTVKKASDFLDAVKADDLGATYGYTDPSQPTPTRSAVGLLCRMYLGWAKEHPGLQDGALRIAKLGPTKDLYYDYYATQIMHHMEGDMWVAWNAKMKSMLVNSQSKQAHEAGSWYEGVNAGHGAHAGGRLYCTSLATMILEVYYRHLPIYKNQSVAEEFRE
jgi:hypothetical protein